MVIFPFFVVARMSEAEEASPCAESRTEWIAPLLFVVQILLFPVLCVKLRLMSPVFVMIRDEAHLL